MFLGKGVLKICSKFTGEYLCRSVISIKLLSNFIEITLRHRCSPVNLLHIFRIPFPKNTSERMLLNFQIGYFTLVSEGIIFYADIHTHKNQCNGHSFPHHLLTMFLWYLKFSITLRLFYVLQQYSSYSDIAIFKAQGTSAFYWWFLVKIFRTTDRMTMIDSSLYRECPLFY